MASEDSGRAISHDWKFAAGEELHQDTETYTVERRVYDADSDEFLYWLEKPEGGHALKTETVVEGHYERGEAGVECSNCGFTDQEEHFDKMGMDLMCPSCGKIGVR